MREERGGREGHVAGQNHARVAARLGQRRVQTAQRPAARHAVSDRSDRDRRLIGCRFTTDDGRTGTGWTEYNWPATPAV